MRQLKGVAVDAATEVTATANPRRAEGTVAERQLSGDVGRRANWRWLAVLACRCLRSSREGARVTYTCETMKTIGHRELPALQSLPSGPLLRFAAAVNDSVASLLPGGRIAAPKGVYRFRTLEEMNRQEEAWLADAMAEAASRRG